MTSDSEKKIERLYGPSPFQFAILAGMNRLAKHIYEGSANPKTVAKRRAKNKVAKASRKANRG